MGFFGPWGTTYPSNLRLLVRSMSEDEWVERMQKPCFARPPMPTYDLNQMSEDDLRAMYRYMVELGPAGDSVPAFVPPDRAPTTPVIRFAPVPPEAVGAPAVQ